ncbi:MAG: hypothetical protein HFF06_05420 [Oscillospiraceae bacterium]|jgi:hypothetical protein|nr:hypothetical protein [Oscillospiraceae bacterium]
MKDLIVSIFGSYEPVMTTEVHLVGDTLEELQVVASGMAGVDWAWLAGAVLFAIVLYSFFRLVGVLLRG